jgi:hypothetical protein
LKLYKKRLKNIGIFGDSLWIEMANDPNDEDGLPY